MKSYAYHAYNRYILATKYKNTILDLFSFITFHSFSVLIHGESHAQKYTVLLCYNHILCM